VCFRVKIATYQSFGSLERIKQEKEMAGYSFIKVEEASRPKEKLKQLIDHEMI